MKHFTLIAAGMVLLSFFSCQNKPEKQAGPLDGTDFQWQIDQFADVRILRYQVDDFDSLSLKQKKLVYYLSQAAVCGRDITFDQNYKYNLLIRRSLEAICEGYKGDRSTDDFKKFEIYLKRVWFSNGIHHHYSTDKFVPEFSSAYFTSLVENTPRELFPQEFEAGFVEELIFSPVAAKRVCLDAGIDLVKCSACNFYEDITEKEVEDFYAKMLDPNDPEPVSYGLNSKLVKVDGKLTEKRYHLGGMYSTAIEKIIYWLEKAAGVAENNEQKETVESLIKYYKTGDLKEFDRYSILWVKDLQSQVDFVNGFIETYGDPLGRKGGWESIVNFKNIEATKRTDIIGKNAQWFEDHSPIDDKFKKKEVKGVSAKVITAAMLGGESYPATPIGVNLPNADWIRKEYGSKSVTIENITYAYDQAAMGSGQLEEFAYSPEEVELAKKWGGLANNLHTDLHECLGHGSGQLAQGIKGDELKNYGSTLEEARADLFALYYMLDDKIVELGLMPTLDAAKAEYSNYIRNGLMVQLTRIELGKNIEESHMRNRKLIAQWCYEKGKADNVIEKKTRDNKSYFVINDFAKLHKLFGELLKEVQRIKSEGDYETGKALVENYAVKVDPVLHKEVLDRYAKLKLAPYAGFVNPVYTLVMKDGEIADVNVEYVTDYSKQMMDYSKNYSYLPTIN
ncbi:MAG: dipeptidyl peptidase 3 [Prevotellaceae bacterium]|nr:dipeptidyl peptidase 3 [Prevotellaceae bacterium]